VFSFGNKKNLLIPLFTMYYTIFW